MEFHSIDIPEMERQRYKAIKASGEYVELNILIGVEDDISLDEEVTTKSPVVTTCLHNCGPKEVACLYATIQSVMKVLERKYPVECLLLSKIGTSVEEIGSIDITKDLDKED